MRKFSPWFIVLGIAVLVGLWLIGSYNGLVSSKAGVDAKWADVEVQYQRRMDLIPNLVNTVKGAAGFEQETLRQVVEARSSWAQASQVGDRTQQIASAGSFDSALSRLLVTVEAYPELKATQAFRDLSVDLAGTENRIAVARRDFNQAVMEYNVKVMRFPGKLAASLFGFLPEKSFDAQPGAETAPTVDFGTSSSQ